MARQMPATVATRPSRPGARSQYRAVIHGSGGNARAAGLRHVVCGAVAHLQRGPGGLPSCGSRWRRSSRRRRLRHPRLRRNRKRRSPRRTSFQQQQTKPHAPEQESPPPVERRPIEPREPKKVEPKKKVETKPSPEQIEREQRQAEERRQNRDRAPHRASVGRRARAVGIARRDQQCLQRTDQSVHPAQHRVRSARGHFGPGVRRIQGRTAADRRAGRAPRSWRSRADCPVTTTRRNGQSSAAIPLFRATRDGTVPRSFTLRMYPTEAR